MANSKPATDYPRIPYKFSDAVEENTIPDITEGLKGRKVVRLEYKALTLIEPDNAVEKEALEFARRCCLDHDTRYQGFVERNRTLNRQMEQFRRFFDWLKARYLFVVSSRRRHKKERLGQLALDFDSQGNEAVEIARAA